MRILKWIFVCSTIMIVLTVGFQSANAQPGFLALRTDVALTDCNIFDSPGVTTFYIVHESTAGTTGSRFQLRVGPGVTMTHLADAPAFANTTGTSVNGAIVDYGSCTSAPFLVMSVTFTSFGNSAVCSEVTLGGYPGENCAGSYECFGVLWAVSTGRAVINPDGSCPCFFYPEGECSGPVPVEASTWGKLKAFYVE